MTYGYVLGWVAYLNGSHRDVIESMEMWSMPLGLINPAFTIRPEKDLVEVIGIVTANSYFWALGLMLIFKFVHSRMRRNRVTELAISGSSVGEEDDGL
jgi:tRNA U34 5-carboxymethylaminomethyl modifying GTPase MnmE/TrmE